VITQEGTVCADVHLRLGFAPGACALP
jgi:hypothetical protein